MSKPVLTFVKMLGCGPCNNFFGNPTPESSQWAQLVKDKELSSKFDFQLVEWGFSAESGDRFKKPAHLDFVNYGPAFVLVDGNDKSQHLEYDKQQPKTAASVKKWALNNVQKLNSSKPKPTTPGAPLAFIPPNQLPPQLQKTVAPQPQKVVTPQVQVAAPVQPPKPVQVQSQAQTGGLRLIARNKHRITRR